MIIKINDISIIDYDLTDKQISRSEYYLTTKDLEILQNNSLALKIKWKYFFDPGRIDGLPENCYSEEEIFEAEIIDIYIKEDMCYNVPKYIIDIFDESLLKKLIIVK